MKSVTVELGLSAVYASKRIIMVQIGLSPFMNRHFLGRFGEIFFKIKSFKF